MSEKLIKKIEGKGQPGGNLYGSVDLPDGEWSVNELIERQNATAAQYVDKYQTTSMGIGTEVPGRVPKPTPAVVVKY
jgi:hypothetical protein